MLADIKRELSTRWASSTRTRAWRCAPPSSWTPGQVIRHVSASTTCPSAATSDEVLRTLDALQTDELCPCNWQKGDETLTQKLAKAG